MKSPPGHVGSSHRGTSGRPWDLGGRLRQCLFQEGTAIGTGRLDRHTDSDRILEGSFLPTFPADTIGGGLDILAALDDGIHGSLRASVTRVEYLNDGICGTISDFKLAYPRFTGRTSSSDRGAQEGASRSVSSVDDEGRVYRVVPA